MLFVFQFINNFSEIESSNVQILRKTVNAIYGALILSTKTIEEFSNI